MSASAPAPALGQGLNPPPQQQQHPPHNMNPMQQLRPLTLPPHSGVSNPQYQQMPQQQHDHMSVYYAHSGGNTPVAANPGVGLGGSTFSPSSSAQYPGHHQQPQPGAVATPTSAVGGAHLFQGMPGVPGNGAYLCIFLTEFCWKGTNDIPIGGQKRRLDYNFHVLTE
ncbi:hypothetical protein BGX38DRAFT_460215 [Terfezia claveryi]|nr:hypothetical protein BGX38DRAFT_460215 [Terfezia claveryi]